MRAGMITRPDAQQQYVSWPHMALKEAIARGPDMQSATADAGTINCIASAAASPHDPPEADSLQVSLNCRNAVPCAKQRQAGRLPCNFQHTLSAFGQHAC